MHIIITSPNSDGSAFEVKTDKQPENIISKQNKIGKFKRKLSYDLLNLYPGVIDPRYFQDGDHNLQERRRIKRCSQNSIQLPQKDLKTTHNAVPHGS